MAKPLFVFVDDGSTDRTAELLRDMQRSMPGRVDVLGFEKNRGKGEAVRAGLLRALERGPALVGYWDADLATPLAVIGDFRAILEDRPAIEMVFGARVQLLGRGITRSSLRHYLGRVVATAIALTLGLDIYDSQCGAKLFRVTPGLADLFREPFSTRWLFDVEIIARLIRARRGSAGPPARDVIYEQPLPVWVDVPGSKVRPFDFFRAFVELARIRRRYFS